MMQRRQRTFEQCIDLHIKDGRAPIFEDTVQRERIDRARRLVAKAPFYSYPVTHRPRMVGGELRMMPVRGHKHDYRRIETCIGVIWQCADPSCRNWTKRKPTEFVPGRKLSPQRAAGKKRPGA